ncbi:DUF1648 domain-containing protein [Clostridium sp. DL1XJH146]
MIKTLLLFMPVYIILFVIGLIMPAVSRKEIFFGIRLPREELHNPELDRVKKEYQITYVLMFVVFILIFILLSLFIELPLVSTIMIFVYIPMFYIPYFRAHKKVKNLKEKKDWVIKKKQVIVVDTKSLDEKQDNKKIGLLFLIPIAILIINTVISLVMYDKLPDRIPIHWNINGEVDNWANKSYGAVLFTSFTQFFLMVIMFFTYKSITMAKVQIDASRPEESRMQIKKSRKIWGLFIIGMTIALSLLFTLINLMILQILSITANVFGIITILFTFGILIVTIILSLKVGQGGSRIKVKSESPNSKEQTKDDDNYYKWGLIYYNPNDPSIFIEKRFGIGWTINFGNKMGILIFGILILAIILFAMFSVKLG